MDERLLRNARIVLEGSCRARAGESVLVVADRKILPYAPALAAAAVQLGLTPAIMDITHFLDSSAYREKRVLQPLRAAMEAADIVIGNTADVHDPSRADYSRLLGDPDLHDSCLTAERRWVYLQPNGMENWDITLQSVVALRERTHWLVDLLRASSSGHISSPLGTDFTFGLGPESSYTPVLGIVPLYGEVAVVPSLTPTHGVLVIDGPTQLDVRPAGETTRPPLRIMVEAGRVVHVDGEAAQLVRLRRFMASGDPSADAIDEVGILTTTFPDNDRYYWSDGTHHHDRVHVALGNNVRRDVVVHGPKHMDGEINRPTISIDGRVIVRDGLFQESKEASS